MVDAPPDVPDQPASSPLILPGADASPIILTRLAWPFQELQAQQVPATLPLARPDVQLTLSQLAGMANGVPKMVQVDAQGNLAGSSPPVPLPPFQTVFGLQTGHSYPTLAGQHGLAVSLPPPFSNFTLLTITGDTTGTTYYTRNPTTDGTAWYVFALPFPWEQSFTVTVNQASGPVGGVAIQVAAILDVVATVNSNPGGPPNLVDWGARFAPYPRPLDGSVQAIPATGTRATATLAAVAAQRWIAHVIMASVVQTAAAAGNVGLRLRDGLSDLGTELWSTVMAVPAGAGSVDRLVLPNLEIEGGVNHAMTLEFDAGVAGLSTWCSLGAYQHL